MYFRELTNGALSFPCKHPFLKKALEYLESSYDPSCWTCIGPKLLTRVAQEMGNVSSTEELTPTPLLPVVPQHVLHPHHYDDALALYFSKTPISFKTYQAMFTKSNAIHFYNALSKNISVEDDPQHFLYALLGPRYCPVSYYSKKYF